MLIELLRRTSEADPDRPVVLSPDGETTYAQALQRAEDLARGLVAREIDRFGAVVGAPAQTIALAAAASAVGSEACIYPADLDDERLEKLVTDFGHDVLVCDDSSLSSSATVLDLDEVAIGTGEAPESVEDAPVLILTTGTTGDQKGARHDWRRLADAVRRPDPEPGTRWLLTYNLNQFAGIQILLHVLVSGSTLVAPRSRQATDAIEAIRGGQVTHVSATPTFWRLLIGGLDQQTAAQLPLAQITLGGEATDDVLIERLRELFPEARISHVYAGTEFGSAVSVRDGRAGLPLSVLERDDDAPAQLKIVDGELYLRSRVGMLGYHGGEDSESEWRPTGDLVEVRGDRIHFVGRRTEIINVGGAKVHPLPIEEAAASVDGVEIAAAYGRPNPVTGQIVALDVVAKAGYDTAEVEAAIRKACEALPRTGRPRRIRFVEALEIRGNKLIRDEVRTAS